MWSVTNEEVASTITGQLPLKDRIYVIKIITIVIKSTNFTFPVRDQTNGKESRAKALELNNC